MSSLVPGKREDRIEPASEAEIKQIWEDFDRITQSSLGGGSNRNLHPVEEGEETPICSEFINDRDPGDWQGAKDIGVFPVGYRDICKFCLAKWRRDYK